MLEKMGAYLILNSKPEARAKHPTGINSKQVRMFEILISKTKKFEILKFGFVSDFDIRISDFSVT
jgi:hypothetical protein